MTEPPLDILVLFADTGIETEVLSPFGHITRVGHDPVDNRFTDRLIASDVADLDRDGGWSDCTPLSCPDPTFDFGIAHPPCQRWSYSTPDQSAHPNYIPTARRVLGATCDHWIIENVPDAPLRDPVVFTGGMFGLPIHYARAFETTFHVAQPPRTDRFRPQVGPLAEQGEQGKAWVGDKEGWWLAKGYSHDWPRRDLKRHAVPAPYLRRLCYWYFAADETASADSGQTGLHRFDAGEGDS